MDATAAAIDHVASESEADERSSTTFSSPTTPSSKCSQNLCPNLLRPQHKREVLSYNEREGHPKAERVGVRPGGGRVRMFRGGWGATYALAVACIVAAAVAGVTASADLAADVTADIARGVAPETEGGEGACSAGLGLGGVAHASRIASDAAGGIGAAAVLANSDAANAYLAELAQVSDSESHLERTFLSPASLRALAMVRGWMHDAGLRTWLDSVGNLHGRLDGPPGEPVLLLGSHIDTVIDGGAYDGTLGIVVAIAAAKNVRLAANAAGANVTRSVEVVAFSDEEGLRFKSTFLGSRAISGSFLQHGYLHAKDSKGYELQSVLENVGLTTARNSEADVAKIAMKPEEIFGYVEVHIEQGPVLQSLRQPLGVVSAISGQTRLYVHVDGFSGHAGTVPMDQRQDALAASARLVSDLERTCRGHPQWREEMLVCTVGELNVFPGASNVIAGVANFSVDVRCKDDAVRQEVIAGFYEEVEATCEDRGVACRIEMKHSAPSSQASPYLMASLKASIEDTHRFVMGDQQREAGAGIDKGGGGGSGDPPDVCSDRTIAAGAGGEGAGLMGEGFTWVLDDVPVIASGAGHDALALAEVTPIGMVFVRCKDGISHSPLEFVREDDVQMATLALYHFLRRELLPA